MKKSALLRPTHAGHEESRACVEHLWSRADASGGDHARNRKGQRRAQTSQSGCRRLLIVAMVRRGRRFESVRGLCKSPARRGFWVQPDLQGRQCAVGMEPFMELSSLGRRLWGAQTLEMAQVHDQQPIETFGADGSHEALRDRVRSRCADRCPDDLDAFACEDGVELAGEFAVAVAAGKSWAKVSMTDLRSGNRKALFPGPFK